MVLLMAVSVRAQRPGATGDAIAGSGTLAPPVLSPERQKQLDDLKMEEKKLKLWITQVNERIATYKSWASYPLTQAQRQETKDKIELEKTQVEKYQTQLAAVQDKIKALDPTTAPGASATPDPKWPFKH